MTETGRIREISGERVTISLERTGACFGCMYKETPDRPCGGTDSGQLCRPDQGLLSALNRNKLPLSPGQLVRVEFPPGSVLIQALTALVPPVLGFITGYILGGVLSPDQAPRAAAGAAGLFISAGMVYFVRRRLPFRQPTVVYYNQDIYPKDPDRNAVTG